MRYATIAARDGREQIRLSQIGFGCGPRAGAMVGHGGREQRDLIRAALEAGVNYLDTAPLYGDGESEANLGAVLHELGADNAIVSTKIEVTTDGDAGQIRDSVRASLRRLRRERLDIVLLHNRVIAPGWTPPRPTHAPGPDWTAAEVLAEDGTLATMAAAVRAGEVGLVGITGYGSDPAAVAEVIAASDQVDLVTVEYHALNPSANLTAPVPEGALDYGAMTRAARQHRASVLALRPLAGAVLAGAVLADAVPAATAPLLRELAELAAKYGCSMAELSWRFATTTGGPPVVVGGFRNPDDLALAVGSLDDEGPAAAAVSELLTRWPQLTTGRPPDLEPSR